MAVDGKTHVKKVKPAGRGGLIQVGIVPDSVPARKLAERTLMWLFVDRVDSGVWTVATPVNWPVGVGAEVQLSSGNIEVKLNVEWP